MGQHAFRMHPDTIFTSKSRKKKSNKIVKHTKITSLESAESHTLSGIFLIFNSYVLKSYIAFGLLHFSLEPLPARKKRQQ